MTLPAATLSTPFVRLKQRLARAERPVQARFTLGHEGTDARLGGGLATAALHELCATKHGDSWAASGFALMLALRAAPGRSILWVREDAGERTLGGLYGPGLADLGADPDRIILVHAPDTLAALRAGADIIAALGPGSVVIETAGAAKALDLTASRRLVLAVERSGATAFILRSMTGAMASAASTRWSVEAAPSARLEADAPGHPALRLALLRHRGGVPPFETLLEWNRDDQAFCEPAPLSGAVPAPVERRQMAA